jgi:hypothetical protein
MRRFWAMRYLMARLAAAAALALLVLAGGAVAGERVPLHQVPRPVLDTVRARFKDARIAATEREREGGKLVYEVTIRHGGHTIDVTLTPDGVMLLIERQITVRELPPPVLAALEERYPRATYKTAEEVVAVEGAQERLTHYAVLLVTAQRKTLEALVNPDGTVLREEK